MDIGFVYLLYLIRIVQLISSFNKLIL
jgi:hypothetical protein